MGKHSTITSERRSETPDQIRRRRLIELAEWAGSQKARCDLGLDSEWRQSVWAVVNESTVLTNGSAAFACGTACCLAGKVAIDDGAQPSFHLYGEWGEAHFLPWHEVPPHRRAAATPSGHKMFFPGLGRVEDVPDYAQAALHLTYHQREALFHSDNDYDDVIRIIGEILYDPTCAPYVDR